MIKLIQTVSDVYSGYKILLNLKSDIIQGLVITYSYNRSLLQVCFSLFICEMLLRDQFLSQSKPTGVSYVVECADHFTLLVSPISLTKSLYQFSKLSWLIPNCVALERCPFTYQMTSTILSNQISITMKVKYICEDYSFVSICPLKHF